jgi:hypothetical protein
MDICTTCWELKGPGAPCRCDRQAPSVPADETEEQQESGIGPWLCHTCQLAVIPPAGRWTLLHCDVCRPEIEQLNRDAGGLVVPLGIHSIVNGLSIQGGRDEVPDDELEEFAARLERMSRRIEWLTAHRRQRTEWLCNELGFADRRTVKLRTFVDKCRDRGFDEAHGLSDLLVALHRDHPAH